MNSLLLKEQLRAGALSKYSCLYDNIEKETERIIAAIEKFEERYGTGRDISVLSVPGRSEILGNHTDHNHGKVMAGAINRDIIAVVAKNDRGEIRFFSEGYYESVRRLHLCGDKKNFKPFSSAALTAGMVKGFTDRGYEVGGFDAYTTTEVLKGSGLSSSAAFEVSIGNALNHLYNGGSVDNKEIAKIAQYSENEYFGKPCGLMDQMACAVGGFVYIDFQDEKNPVVEPIEFSLGDHGYSLCIVNTGGSHSNLNDDYASVPAEMKAVAGALGRDVLRGLSRDDIVKILPALRRSVGDRAIMRAMHFLAENERVEAAGSALTSGDIDGFLHNITASGSSSFKFLQNVYTTQNVREQGLSLALCLTEEFLRERGGACRVHGGGFAGTIQGFIRREDVSAYRELMDGALGEGSVMPLFVRPLGACKLF